MPVFSRALGRVCKHVYETEEAMVKRLTCAEDSAIIDLKNKVLLLASRGWCHGILLLMNVSHDQHTVAHVIEGGRFRGFCQQASCLPSHDSLYYVYTNSDIDKHKQRLDKKNSAGILITQLCVPLCKKTFHAIHLCIFSVRCRDNREYITAINRCKVLLSQLENIDKTFINSIVLHVVKQKASTNLKNDTYVI